MSQATLDDAVIDLLEPAGWAERDGEVIGLTNGSDVTLWVRRAASGRWGADTIELLRQERAEGPSVVMRAASFEDIERRLVMELGSAARSRARLGRIVLPWQLGQEANGCRVDELGDWWYSLTTPGSGAASVDLPGAGYNEAVRFSHVALIPLGVLAASYLAPDGAPALQRFVTDIR